MAEHNIFGEFGEQYAVDYLLKKGYIICHRNYIFLKAEIDIIAKKLDTLIIIEVKIRSTDFIDNMADLISQKKIKLLVSAADQYILANNIDMEVRFDVITIFKTKDGFKLNHVKDAFYHF
tara:strand:+ start:188602 stop:188961 length:360 start_codon:yes stop_codon:yes gene_type:complete